MATTLNDLLNALLQNPYENKITGMVVQNSQSTTEYLIQTTEVAQLLKSRTAFVDQYETRHFITDMQQQTDELVRLEFDPPLDLSALVTEKVIITFVSGPPPTEPTRRRRLPQRADAGGGQAPTSKPGISNEKYNLICELSQICRRQLAYPRRKTESFGHGHAKLPERSVGVCFVEQDSRCDLSCWGGTQTHRYVTCLANDRQIDASTCCVREVVQEQRGDSARLLHIAKRLKTLYANPEFKPGELLGVEDNNETLTYKKFRVYRNLNAQQTQYGAAAYIDGRIVDPNREAVVSERGYKFSNAQYTRVYGGVIQDVTLQGTIEWPYNSKEVTAYAVAQKTKGHAEIHFVAGETPPNFQIIYGGFNFELGDEVVFQIPMTQITFSTIVTSATPKHNNSLVRAVNEGDEKTEGVVVRNPRSATGYLIQTSKVAELLRSHTAFVDQKQIRHFITGMQQQTDELVQLEFEPSLELSDLETKKVTIIFFSGNKDVFWSNDFANLNDDMTLYANVADDNRLRPYCIEKHRAEHRGRHCSIQAKSAPALHAIEQTYPLINYAAATWGVVTDYAEQPQVSHQGWLYVTACWPGSTNRTTLLNTKNNAHSAQWLQTKLDNYGQVQLGDEQTDFFICPCLNPDPWFDWKLYLFQHTCKLPANIKSNGFELHRSQENRIESGSLTPPSFVPPEHTFDDAPLQKQHPFVEELLPPPKQGPYVHMTPQSADLLQQMLNICHSDAPVNAIPDLEQCPWNLYDWVSYGAFLWAMLEKSPYVTNANPLQEWSSKNGGVHTFEFRTRQDGDLTPGTYKAYDTFLHQNFEFKLSQESGAYKGTVLQAGYGYAKNDTVRCVHENNQSVEIIVKTISTYRIKGGTFLVDEECLQFRQNCWRAFMLTAFALSADECVLCTAKIYQDEDAVTVDATALQESFRVQVTDQDFKPKKEDTLQCGDQEAKITEVSQITLNTFRVFVKPQNMFSGVTSEDALILSGNRSVDVTAQREIHVCFDPTADPQILQKGDTLQYNRRPTLHVYVGSVQSVADTQNRQFFVVPQNPTVPIPRGVHRINVVRNVHVVDVTTVPTQEFQLGLNDLGIKCDRQAGRPREMLTAYTTGSEPTTALKELPGSAADSDSSGTARARQKRKQKKLPQRASVGRFSSATR